MGVDLPDMQSLSKYNKGIKYLLCEIDLFSKYARVVPIKDKKGTSITNAFKKILSDSNRKPNKIWVDQGSDFYNKSFKVFFKINNIESYSAYNEGKSVVAERFIRTLKNKIFIHMTAISKNVSFDVLDVAMLEFQNIKTFLLKGVPQIGQKKFLLLVKLKILFLGLMLLMIEMGKKLLEVFMKKNCKKLMKNNLE